MNMCVALVLGTTLLGLPAFSQDEGGLKRSEASAQFFGTFVKGTTQDDIRQSSSDSGGILSSYRFFFTDHHGVEVNYGYSRSTQTYNALGVSSNQHEISAAYVFRMSFGRIKPYVETGVGALVFQPRDLTNASVQGRAAWVYGGGADFSVTRHLFLRAQYRGFVYNSPTMNAFEDRIHRTTHLAEPSVGFGVRF